MGDSVDNTVNEVFYERSQTFIRENLLNNGKKPTNIHVVCYPEVTEADIRTYSGLGVPQKKITGYKGNEKDIDILSIANTKQLDKSTEKWLAEEISAKEALSDKSIVATHFDQGDIDPYKITKKLINLITTGMNYVRLNPIFARNPLGEKYAGIAINIMEKLEEGEKDVKSLIELIMHNQKPDPEKIDKFNVSPDGIYGHLRLLNNYLLLNGFPHILADLALHYEGKSHAAKKHWAYKYRTESGKQMIIDFLFLDRLRDMLERYKDLFDKIYNGLESMPFEGFKKRLLLARKIIRDYKIMGGVSLNILNKRYKRKELQPVREIKSNNTRAETKEDFEAFVKQVREQGVFIYDSDVKRLSKNAQRLGLQPNEAKRCNSVNTIEKLKRRGIEYYMSQQEFGLYVLQGDADVINALETIGETIGLNPNGKSPRIIIIGNGSSLEQQVNESVETLSELGIEVCVGFLKSTKGHIQENTRLAEALKHFN